MKQHLPASLLLLLGISACAAAGSPNGRPDVSPNVSPALTIARVAPTPPPTDAATAPTAAMIQLRKFTIDQDALGGGDPEAPLVELDFEIACDAEAGFRIVVALQDGEHVAVAGADDAQQHVVAELGFNEAARGASGAVGSSVRANQEDVIGSGDDAGFLVGGGRCGSG